ncbi:MAG TPA: efflux RND transporter permease subunit [Nocardioides sp.]
MIERWGGVVARRAGRVLAIALLLAVAAGAFGAGIFGSLSNGGFGDPDSESARAVEQSKELFGAVGVDVVALYGSADLDAGDPAFREAVLATVAGYEADAVGRVVTPWSDETGSLTLTEPNPAMVSTDGRTVQVLVSLTGDSQDEMAAEYDALAPSLQAGSDTGLRTDVAGTWATYVDVNDTVSEDLKRAELLSLPVVLLLSLLIFGSVVAASMPVMVAGFAVIGGLAIVRVITLLTEVSVFSINVITLLGMGLAIDYALFVISRFREELAKEPDGRVDGRGADREAARAAIVRTMATAGRTVMFSGLTVAVAMSSLLVFPVGFLRSLGYGGFAAVVVAMLAALTVLPAVLVLLGRRIDAGRVPLLNRRRTSPSLTRAADGRWADLARAVMRRPLTYIVVIGAALLAVASPFLHVGWGGVDYRGLPHDAPAYVASEKLATAFGEETSSAEVLVVGLGAEDPDLQEYVARLPAALGDRADATTAAVAATTADGADGGPATLVRVTWPGGSQDDVSQDAVRDLRDVAAPAGADDVLVGGLSADTVDLLAAVGDGLPLMGLVVVVTMFVLLFLAFGSLVLPLKAIAMNVLSITASFGVVTWIFADGHLEGLLDFTSSGYLDATQPILMLAILFGLSMDYEVFLLSRVREEWDRSGDNERAVAAGLQKTGRIITSAALLLAVVIGAFATSGIVFMKLIGVGMLVALLLDATVVRALLVPATMRLLGRWNWWAPGPLRRWWERYGFREA